MEGCFLSSREMLGVPLRVTHIAQNLGLLKNASLSYIEDIDRWYIDNEYFLKAHMLKKNNNGQLVMMYLGYTTEIPLLLTLINDYWRIPQAHKTIT